MMRVGVSCIDITPPPGLAMAGFAARGGPATGAHDALSVRALVVEETALVVADVIGIDAALSARVRARAPLPAKAITIAATHTHGGPVSMPGRLSATADAAYMARLEEALVQAIQTAHARREPARLCGGSGADPGFARNRRAPGGAVDAGVPVLRFDMADGKPLAFLVSHACHPVVLGADNRLWTADYPHFLRARIEARHPGAVALFATGCAGDVNTGHSAAASLTEAAQADRSFARAREIGEALAEAALAAPLSPLQGPAAGAEAHDQLRFAQREAGSPAALARDWAARAQAPGDIHAIWADWAQTRMGRDLAPCPARVSALHWGGARLLALPGEIFAATALELRAALPGAAPLHIIAYADDNPGYIPPRAEYAAGGYEVDEAHRFYGLGAAMAPGVAEALANAARRAAETAARRAAHGCGPKKTEHGNKES